jgi:hypothetical protein
MKLDWANRGNQLLRVSLDVTKGGSQNFVSFGHFDETLLQESHFQLADQANSNRADE